MVYNIEVRRFGVQVEVSRTDDYIQVRIPIREGYNNRNIRRFLDYLRVKEIAAKSQAVDEDIERLSDEIMQNWWDENKGNFQ